MFLTFLAYNSLIDALSLSSYIQPEAFKFVSLWNIAALWTWTLHYIHKPSEIGKNIIVFYAIGYKILKSFLKSIVPLPWYPKEWRRLVTLETQCSRWNQRMDVDECNIGYLESKKSRALQFKCLNVQNNVFNNKGLPNTHGDLKNWFKNWPVLLNNNEKSFSEEIWSKHSNESPFLAFKHKRLLSLVNIYMLWYV